MLRGSIRPTGLPLHFISAGSPIALIKTNSEVEPALMKCNGKPVGRIEPLNTSYCIMNFQTKKEHQAPLF